MHDTSSDPDVLGEAERWWARLRGAATPGELTAFERWHAVPEHAAAWARTERLWHDLGKLDGHPELERMAAAALAATARRPRRRWPIAIAAAACLVLAVASLAVFRPPPPTIYATGPAQRRTVALEDGSHVMLNGDTEIAVRMRKRSRELTLRRGEAVFEVAHDAQRPFRVAAGGGLVTALGTHFQVSKRDRQVTVTLLEGSVTVDRDRTDEHLRLQPGEQAAFAVDSGRMATRSVDTAVVSSWTQGRLLFRATPLAEVIAEVNRYATTPLRLADPSLASTPVSGTFPIGDSRSVALGLQALLPLRADTTSADRIVLRRR
jgi:transmembrane sensor